MEINLQKKLVASTSILSNGIIIILKFIAGFISGSISIISEAIHSFSDFLASVLTLFAVTRSSEPADKDHPFGHGKYEDMSGFIEGFLIILASIYIIYEASKKLIFGYHAELDSEICIFVMAFAVIANILVSKSLFHVAKKSNSISLYADAEHLRTDIFSSLGVLIGLIVIKFTGLTILDPIIAIIVAGIIFKAGYTITKETLNNLLDGSISKGKIEEITQILDTFTNIKGYKDLKARNIGPLVKVEITILFDNNMTIYDCHKICDDIEHAISKKMGNTSVIIHSEPVNINPQILQQ